MEEPLELSPQQLRQDILSIQKEINQCLARWNQEGNAGTVQLARLLTRQAQLTALMNVEAQQALSNRGADSMLTNQKIQAIVERVSETTVLVERLSRTTIQQDKILKQNTQQIAALALLFCFALLLQLFTSWR